MGPCQSDGSGRARSESQLARVLRQGAMRSNSNADDRQGSQETQDRLDSPLNHRMEPSPSRLSFPSLNQKTPARSYFQHSLQDSHHGKRHCNLLLINIGLQTSVPINTGQIASQGVREDTAELASLALSDIASSRSDRSPARHHLSSISHQKSDTYLGSYPERDDPNHPEIDDSPRPHAIEEVSEPSSRKSSQSTQYLRCQSALTELIKSSPPTEGGSQDTSDEEMITMGGIYPVTVREGIISQPGEHNTLLAKQTAYGTIKDIENQKTNDETQGSKSTLIVQRIKDRVARLVRIVTNPKPWSRKDIWKNGVRHSASLIPSVMLGLLLNVLDALSYGQTYFVELFKRHN